MKKLHNKILATCALGVLTATPIAASASPITAIVRGARTITTGTKGLNIRFLSTQSTTPAGIILQSRQNSNEGITTILTSTGSSRPQIVYPQNQPFLSK